MRIGNGSTSAMLSWNNALIGGQVEDCNLVIGTASSIFYFMAVGNIVFSRAYQTSALIYLDVYCTGSNAHLGCPDIICWRILRSQGSAGRCS